MSRQIEFTRYYENIGVNAPQWQDIAAIIRSSASQLPSDASAPDITFTGMRCLLIRSSAKCFITLWKTPSVMEATSQKTASHLKGSMEMQYNVS